jgi:methylmalonyl-CoA mutase N-terminal domain/subunit
VYDGEANMYDKGKIEEIAREREKYEKAVVEKALEKIPEGTKKFSNLSGMDIKRLYTPEDTENSDYLKDLGFPGQYP